MICARFFDHHAARKYPIQHTFANSLPSLSYSQKLRHTFFFAGSIHLFVGLRPPYALLFPFARRPDFDQFPGCPATRQGGQQAHGHP
jgi:hypothetical protein